MSSRSAMGQAQDVGVRRLTPVHSLRRGEAAAGYHAGCRRVVTPLPDGMGEPGSYGKGGTLPSMVELYSLQAGGGRTSTSAVTTRLAPLARSAS